MKRAKNETDTPSRPTAPFPMDWKGAARRRGGTERKAGGDPNDRRGVDGSQ